MEKRLECSLEYVCPVRSSDSDQCCVALLSPNDLLAEGIAQGLLQDEKIFVQNSFDTFNSLMAFQGPTCYEVMLINARLIQYPLADFFQQLKKKTSNTRFIVFAAESDQQFLKALMRAGVYGFLPMDASVSELCNAILAVKSGQLWYSKSLLDEMVFDAMEFERLIEQSIKERIDALKEQLTSRERDVFCLVLEGLSTKQIAAQINMSEPSVKQYLTRLFKKFNVTNRLQLILVAYERVCPVTNIVKMFRRTVDRRRTENGQSPLIQDPLQD